MAKEKPFEEVRLRLRASIKPFFYYLLSPRSIVEESPVALLLTPTSDNQNKANDASSGVESQ